MKYEDVEKLTSDEVRVAVSEAWYGGKCDKELGGIVVQPTQDNLFDGGLFPLLDLADPGEHMKLMEKIWEKDDSVMLGMEGTYWGWNEESGFFEYEGFQDTDDDIWQSIARAWLVICGDE